MKETASHINVKEPKEKKGHVLPFLTKYMKILKVSNLFLNILLL
jgi:hypothetical protein